MKKVSAFILTASIGVVLSACGNGGTESDSASESGGTEGGGSATLQISVEDNYNEFIEAIRDDFEAEHNVTIEVTNRTQLDQAEALPLDGPAGIGPDVTMFPYDRIGSLAQQGHLTEVSIPDDGRFEENDIQQVTVNDATYGMPAILETLIMYYNKDLIEEAPSTFEELEALAQDDAYAFQGGDNNVGFLVDWLDFYYSYGLFSGFGGYVFGDNGTDPSDIGLNTPESVEALEYIGSWYQNVWPEGMQDASSAKDFVDAQFIEGNTAAVITGPWGAGNYEDGGVNFGAAAIPTLPNGEEYQPFAGGRGWVISSYTDNMELAQEWLNYVSEYENQMAFYETIGEIPMNAEARETILAEGTEVEQAVLEQYQNADPMPNIPQMAEVWDSAQVMTFDVASGAKSPQQAADDAVQTIEQMIEQKY